MGTGECYAGFGSFCMEGILQETEKRLNVGIIGNQLLCVEGIQKASRKTLQTTDPSSSPLRTAARKNRRRPGKGIRCDAQRILQQQLKVPCQQQNIQQPGAVQIGEVFLAKRDEKRAIRTFLQKNVCGPPLRLLQRPRAYQRFEIVQMLVAVGEKMLETEIQRFERYDCRVRADG